MTYYEIVRSDTGEYYSTDGGYGSNVGILWTRNRFHAALYSNRQDAIKILQLLRREGFKVKLDG